MPEFDPDLVTIPLTLACCVGVPVVGIIYFTLRKPIAHMIEGINSFHQENNLGGRIMQAEKNIAPLAGTGRFSDAYKEEVKPLNDELDRMRSKPERW